MGLLQVSSSETSKEKAGPLSTAVYSVPQSGSVDGAADQTCGDSRYYSLRDFRWKRSMGFSESPNGFKDATPDIQPPISRIVGFNCIEKDKVVGGPDYCYPPANSNANGTESSGSHVRKRMLSPLTKLLLPDRLIGDSLDIGSRNFSSSYHSSKDMCGIYSVQEYKKANIGGKNHSTTPIWNECCKNNSAFFSDGPVLGDREVIPFSYVPFCGIDQLSESDSVGFHSGTKSSSTKPGSHPLSFSPLGPRFGNKEEILKKAVHSLDESTSGVIFSSKEEEFRITRISSEDIDIFQREAQCSSLETKTGKKWPFCQNLRSGSYKELGKNLRGFPVRRSLVGSFEESLLSGRLSFGKCSQVISNVSLSLLAFQM